MQRDETRRDTTSSCCQFANLGASRANCLPDRFLPCFRSAVRLCHGDLRNRLGACKLEKYMAWASNFQSLCDFQICMTSKCSNFVYMQRGGRPSVSSRSPSLLFFFGPFSSFFPRPIGLVGTRMSLSRCRQGDGRVGMSISAVVSWGKRSIFSTTATRDNAAVENYPVDGQLQLTYGTETCRKVQGC